ncbi:MAG: hypothetical protein B6A08_03950 [Sorangiineae bacterium NIC37A_2]|jgi:F-type H+-transporting ATPase subunit b|nr:MAG: hypothetical protein B6A08_03950 [Sorangiineae bacterium NIC37A_2]
MKKFIRSVLVLGALSVPLSAFASAPHAEHGEGEHAASEHGGHGHDHVPHISEVNWIDGIFSREEGTPIPLAALLLNTAVLAYLIVRFGGPAVKNGLVARQRQILSDVDAAAAMKREAEAQLEEYETRLARLTAETQEIQRSMAEQAALERKQLLAEAEAQRDAMVRDAEERLGHELRAHREQMIRDAISDAVRLAEEALARDARVLGSDALARQLLASFEGSNTQKEARS